MICYSYIIYMGTPKTFLGQHEFQHLSIPIRHYFLHKRTTFQLTWVPKFKILVCGGRDFGELYVYNDFKKKRVLKKGDALITAGLQKQFVFDTLDEIYPEYTSDADLLIINGAGWGADMCSTQWATRNNIKYHEYPADWKRHKNAAGPIRNQKMLDEEVEYDRFNKPLVDKFLVVAFPGDKGTNDMITRSEKLGITVKKIVYHDLRNSNL